MNLYNVLHLIINPPPCPDNYVVNVDNLNPVKLSVLTCDKNNITILSLNCKSIRSLKKEVSSML